MSLNSVKLQLMDMASQETVTTPSVMIAIHSVYQTNCDFIMVWSFKSLLQSHIPHPFYSVNDATIFYYF